MAGSSQTAYRTFWMGPSGSSAFHIPPAAMNSTPNATPMTAAMTMSRVRQRVSGAAVAASIIVVIVFEPPDRTCETPSPFSGDGVVDDVRPASFAGMNRIRFGGSVAWATLSARRRSPEAIFG